MIVTTEAAKAMVMDWALKLMQERSAASVRREPVVNAAIDMLTLMTREPHRYQAPELVTEAFAGLMDRYSILQLTKAATLLQTIGALGVNSSGASADQGMDGDFTAGTVLCVNLMLHIPFQPPGAMAGLDWHPGFALAPDEP